MRRRLWIVYVYVYIYTLFIHKNLPNGSCAILCLCSLHALVKIGCFDKLAMHPHLTIYYTLICIILSWCYCIVSLQGKSQTLMRQTNAVESALIQSQLMFDKPHKIELNCLKTFPFFATKRHISEVIVALMV